MARKDIVVLVFILVGFAIGAVVAYSFFDPATWSQAKSIIYFFGFIGALIGYFIARKKGK